ncbi:MAG TPA: DUF881 domain-containing protein [Actinopolymorphaceae bacterium]
MPTESETAARGWPGQYSGALAGSGESGRANATVGGVRQQRYEPTSVMRDLMTQAMDDGYSLAAARHGPDAPRSRAWFAGSVVVLVVLGLMLTMAAIQTRRSAPAAAAEKAQLIEQIKVQNSRLEQLQSRAGELEGEISDLQNEVLTRTTSGQNLQRRLRTLGVLAGTSPVRGPGIRITVDDAPTDSVANPDHSGRILDIDLQQTVNGLWAAGAEAIAINGRRLSSLTAIRGADEAITVDYRPLSRPYVIEAIGDPNTLESRFLTSPGGGWLADLKAQEHVPLEITTLDELELPADSGIHIRFASTEGSK